MLAKFKTCPARYLVQAVLMAAGLAFILLFLYTSLKRAPYPYELEWMEGGSVEHVRRVLEGRPIYIQPSLTFTPFIYTPLFFYLSALAALPAGVGFLPLRLVSLLSTLGCFAVIFAFARREAKSAAIGIFSAGIFAATYEIGGTWFDLARTDMLFLLLLLASAWVLSTAYNAPGLAVAGFLGALAFLTKQTALASTGALALYALVARQGWRRFIYGGVFLVVAGGVSLALNLSSGGWFGYYVFILPNQHVIHTEMLPQMMNESFLQVLPVALPFALLFFVHLIWKKPAREQLFHIFFAGSVIGAAWLARMHAGGYVNVLIPAYAVIAVYAGLGTAKCIDFLISSQFKKFSQISRVLTIVVVLMLWGWQLRLLAYSPARFIPTYEDRKAGEAFIQRIKEIDGEVFIPYHSYYTALAGKSTYAQGMAMEDVFRGTDLVLRDSLKREICSAIENRRFAAIILDGDWRCMAEIRQNYESVAELFEGNLFTTVTGMPTRPQRLYLAVSN